MNLYEYLEQLQGKTVAVIGFGVSNRPLVELLLRHGIEVSVRDRRTDLGDAGAEMAALGATFQLGDAYLDNLTADVIFRTPGLRPDVPALANAKGEVTSEMEVFCKVCPCPIIAVTGSDGKTTTTTLIAELLKAAGHTVHVGGNIGTPLLSQAGEMAPTDFAVLELSSFQLMTMTTSPHIAVMTNLAPNHLDYHTDMEEYVAAKVNLIAHQGADDIAIFNADNALTAQLANTAKGTVRTFSRQGAVQDGLFLRDGMIYLAQEGRETAILSAKEIRIPGLHNVENFMAAMAAVFPYVSGDMFSQVAKTFPGVAHRIQWVRTLDGVAYYNDSIASSPSRTTAGLRAFPQKVILIAGGYDKHIPFDDLGVEIVNHVKYLILCGHTAEKIRQAVEQAPGYDANAPTIVTVDTLAQAVEQAHGLAQQGDVVTLSPGCASFDQFPNFAVRGEKFCELVNALK